VGDNAVPAFIDYDGDGDFDLLVSQNTSPQTVSQIALYQNTGTSEAPAFKLIEEDLWGFSQLPFYNLKLQFADITGDSRLDVVFTATNIQTSVTKLYYVEGAGNGVINVSGQQVQQTDVAIGTNENVLVADVDRNGLADLLIGKTTGSLEYWRNRADGSNAFELFDNSFLGLGSSVLRQNLACAIDDLDGDGKIDLVLGDQTGTLSIVPNYRAAADASGAAIDLVYNDLTETYEHVNLGGRVWPTTVNLYGSTRPTIVVGNVLGGISILKHDGGEDLPGEPVVDIYPNPVTRGNFIAKELTIRTDRPAFMQAFSSLGQVLTESQYLLGNEEYSFSVASLAAGVYILRFTIENKTFSKRIVVY
jgi:hypothetical protein